MITPQLSTAIDIARGAGKLLLNATGSRRAEYKIAETDLVTEYDRRSEAYIVQALLEAFPHHAIRAEEGTRRNNGAEFEWLIDPLDGTTNFAHGLPIFSVNLTLLQGEQPVLGVTYDPSRDELFTAEKGRGAFLNGQRLRVSTTGSLGRALLVTGFPYDIRTSPVTNLQEFNNFALRSQAVRRLGSAALDLAYVAAGRLDGYWELKLKPWDVGAGVLMVREAGGVVTDCDGNDAPVPVTILASNGLLHTQMLEVLRMGDDAPKPV